MNVLKDIKNELFLFTIILLSIFFYKDFDKHIYNFFYKYGDLGIGVYFRQFFEEITILGDSQIYFVTSVLFIFAIFICKKLNFISYSKSSKAQSFIVLLLLNLTIVSLITQLLKHIIGRVRPNSFVPEYHYFGEGLDFSFFTLNSNFHSFPSGHTTTIFIVCILLSAILPKLKYVFYITAIIVSLSRIVTGAHYLSDVVGAIILTLIIFKLINIYLKKYKNFNIKNFEIYNLNEVNIFILCLLFFCIILTIGPSLDIYISGLFWIDNSYDSKPIFYIQANDYLSIIFRKIFLPVVLIYIFVLPLLSKFKVIKTLFFFNYKFSLKKIIFIFSTQITILLFFVNYIFKTLWGRTRPKDIINFGGDDYFTPWFEIGEVCQKNCSFVSGDASVGFSLIVLYFITKKIVFFYLSILLGFSIGFVRVGEGGHFISDVLFSGLMVVALNLIFFKAFKKYYE